METTSYDLTHRVEDEAVSVEHELILAAHGVTEGDETTIVARTLRQHALSFSSLASMVG